MNLCNEMTISYPMMPSLTVTAFSLGCEMQPSCLGCESKKKTELWDASNKVRYTFINHQNQIRAKHHSFHFLLEKTMTSWQHNILHNSSAVSLVNEACGSKERWQKKGPLMVACFKQSNNNALLSRAQKNDKTRFAQHSTNCLMHLYYPV